MRYSIETRDFFADIISSVSTELHSKKKYNNNKNNNNNNNNDNEDVELTTHKKRYIAPEERQQNINELRLVSKKVFLKIISELMLILKIYIYLKEK